MGRELQQMPNGWWRVMQTCGLHTAHSRASHFRDHLTFESKEHLLAWAVVRRLHPRLAIMLDNTEYVPSIVGGVGMAREIDTALGVAQAMTQVQRDAKLVEVQLSSQSRFGSSFACVCFSSAVVSQGA